MTDRLGILTNKNADEVARYVVACFGKEENKENIDYDFNLKQGKMKKANSSTPKVNTSFKFDTEENTLLREIKDVILGLEDMTAEEGTIILNFLIKVRDIINATYQDCLKEQVRKNILGGATKELFPLEDVEVINFEVGEVPEVDYILVIQKMSPKSDIAQRVNEDLLERHLETKKDLDDIIAERKAADDERYKYVTGAYKKKWFFECQLDLFVDYSLVEMPKIPQSE